MKYFYKYSIKTTALSLPFQLFIQTFYFWNLFVVVLYHFARERSRLVKCQKCHFLLFSLNFPGCLGDSVWWYFTGRRGFTSLGHTQKATINANYLFFTFCVILDILLEIKTKISSKQRNLPSDYESVLVLDYFSLEQIEFPVITLTWKLFHCLYVF